MVKKDRAVLSRSFAPEALETRNLLSTLIGSPPTIDAYNGPGVSHNQFGGINITQPAVIQVFGTAQPGSPGSTVSVSIFAEDSEGNLVNNGLPLATTTPDSLGQYHTTVTLPSRLRADVNYLVARETASAVQTMQLAINPTTLSGLNGSQAINPGTLSGLTGTVANPVNTLTNLTGNISNPVNTLSNLTGNVSNPANTLSNFGGSVTTAATPISDLSGTISIPVFPVGAGTGGPAVGTLLGGAGTLGAQVGTISGGSGTLGATTSTLANGTGTIGATTSTLANGTGTIGATTSLLNQTGTAAESNRTGTFTQTGTAAIASTTGTATYNDQEVATSTPLVVYIHQPKIQGSIFAKVAKASAHSHATTGLAAAVSHAKAVHAVQAHKQK